MRNIANLHQYFDQIFNDLNKYAVGFEPTFRMLDRARNSAALSGYPPYDLETISKTASDTEDTVHYRLSMAVAGFSADDIEITLQDSILSIEGRSREEDARSYLHKGIAGRSFRRSFCLSAMVKVTDVNLDQGILTIDFLQTIPAAPKTFKIAIGNGAPAIESKPKA